MSEVVCEHAFADPVAYEDGAAGELFWVSACSRCNAFEIRADDPRIDTMTWLAARLAAGSLNLDHRPEP